jgi:hypothetical protein
LIRGLGTLATVTARIASGHLESAVLAALPGVTAGSVEGSRIDLHSDNVQQTLVALLELSTREGIDLDDLSAAQASLEDVFLALTGRTFQADTPAPAGEAADRPDREPAP